MLFKNDDLEKQYVRDGYVVIPLLSSEELNTIKNLYHQKYTESFSGLQPLLRLGDPEGNILLHHEIGHIFSPILDNWFLPFAYNANHFIVKGANDRNPFGLHQDWNVVDESKYIAAHIWVAMQDVDETNGALLVLKGSHNLFDNVRSGSCGIAFIENTEKIRPYQYTIPVKSGEAIVYQQALFHGSHPNTSGEPRLICLTSIRPKEAAMIYYQQNGDLLQTYEISPEILLRQLDNLEKGQPPKEAPIVENNIHLSYKTSYLSTNVMEDALANRS